MWQCSSGCNRRGTLLKAVSWPAYQQGGAKVAEAAVIYQELGERHNWTGRLYNGAAGCAAAQVCRRHANALV